MNVQIFMLLKPQEFSSHTPAILLLFVEFLNIHKIAYIMQMNGKRVN